MHYNGFRYYDPKIGRYLRADPIGLEGGVNLYIYVQNNSINLIDSYGLKVETCSRWIGALGGSPTGHNNPLRHEYIKVSDQFVGFFPKEDGRLWTKGDVRWGDEKGKNCKTICDDDSFDQYVIEVIIQEPTPDYVPLAYERSIFYALGARNCQTWADDIIKKAKQKYLDKEQCPKCFQQ